MNTWCASCLPHCASGRAYGIRRVLGDSLMYLLDKQIRMGRGAKPSSVVFLCFLPRSCRSRCSRYPDAARCAAAVLQTTNSCHV